MQKHLALKPLLPLGMLLIVLVVSFGLWANAAPAPAIEIYSDTGTWDLRSVDFSNTNIEIKGSMEYIPGVLLNPEEFAARADDIRLGDPSNTEFCITSRIRLVFPDDGWYAFDRISTDYSERLYVNGEWLLDVGKPGNSRESTVPNTARITFTAKAVDGVIEIVQQSANFVHKEGGRHFSWLVGNLSLKDDVRKADYLMNIILGCYLALFTIHIFLFFMLGGHRVNIYAALCCLMWFLRAGVTGSKVFSVLFSWLGWYAKFRIEYLGVPISSLLIIAVIHDLFPGALPKWFKRTTFAVSAASALMFLFADTVLMSRTALWGEGLCVLGILYAFLRLVLCLRKPKLEQVLLIVGAVLVFYAAIRDFLFSNSIFLPPFSRLGNLMSLAMLIFAILQTVSVFIATMRERERDKENERQLTAERAALDRVNTLKTSLMRTISHELRTPLAVMMGFAELAAEEGRKNGIDTDALSHLDAIAAEARHMADIVEEMRIIALEKEYKKDRMPVSVEAVIRQVAALYAHVLERKGTRLTLDIEKNLPPVLGNGTELTSVIFNLLRNADLHTEHGVVTIRAERINGVVQIQISDTGTGIEPALLPHVFERGVHGKGEGTGFGLAICKDIITAYGGDIEIASEQYKGTAVTFTLPSYDNEEGGKTHA